VLEIATEPPVDPATADRLAELASTTDAAAGAGDVEAARAAMAQALVRAGDAGADVVVVDVEPAGDDHDRALTGVGLRRTRDLLQLRRALPLDGPARGDAAAVATRPYVPGVDDEAWLHVNNRAFAWHPEQGGWRPADLAARRAEPWFDAAGFLVHDEDDGLAGFCWTKVHADDDPPLGEIFVIAVDPAFRGRGLGRALTLAGLDHLAARGLTVAMLYVEADNAAALTLYRDLGFSVHHRHRWYRGPAGGHR
jgi:mycothiol synthase